MTTITALPTPPTRADPTNFPDRADALMLALPTMVTETNAVAAEVNANAAAAIQAAASAAAAPGTNGTSASSVAIGTGAKAFVTQAGKAWLNQYLLISDTVTPTNWMYGQITGYAGTALTVNVLATSGAGTIASWNISTVGPFLPATAAEIRAGTASNVMITPAALIAALADVVIADAATITPVFSTFINATITLGGNRTLANPTIAAADVGKSGRIKLVQDATGSRTLAFGSNWLFDGGVDLVLSIAAGAVDYIYYDIESITRIIVSTKKGVA
ncbi:hypothetical protein O4H52_07860 [Sphingomonadaceae bacterium G21617-S1]|nr:hypothetical protein [Sphingomonadaceae bacterium G21617-S1]